MLADEVGSKLSHPDRALSVTSASPATLLTGAMVLTPASAGSLFGPVQPSAFQDLGKHLD